MRFDTRKHTSFGIFWNGFIYEWVPELAHVRRVMIVEDNGDHLIVSDYSCGHSGRYCQPSGKKYKAVQVGMGRPTVKRVEALKVALRSQSVRGGS